MRTWQAAYAHVFGAERLAGMDVDARAERWGRWLEDGEAAFVAEDDGRIVGFSWVGPSRDEDAEGELYAIYALPDAWGTGAGAQLMDAGVESMRASGYRDAVLWVLEDNPRRAASTSARAGPLTAAVRRPSSSACASRGALPDQARLTGIVTRLRTRR